MDPLAILIALLIVVTAYYALATRQLMKAYEKTVEAVKSQTEAFVRPHITVTHFWGSDGGFYLKIHNAGRMAAENLLLKTDQSVLQHDVDDASHARAALQPFQESISTFPPGAELTVALPEPEAAETQALVNITATYSYAGKPVSEQTTIDLRPYRHRARERETLNNQLLAISKEVEGLARRLESVKQDDARTDAMPEVESGGDGEIGRSVNGKSAPLLEDLTPPMLPVDTLDTQWLIEETLENDFNLARINKEVEGLVSELKSLKQDYTTRGYMPWIEDKSYEVIEITEDMKPVPLLDGLTKPKILLVEDNEDTQWLIEELLKYEFDVTIAANAEEAVLDAFQIEYDIVLMDINLGEGANGEVVLGELRAMPMYRSVPIAAITAYALPGDRERFLQMGFSAYLPKPFTAKELMVLLTRLQASRRQDTRSSPEGIKQDPYQRFS